MAQINKLTPVDAPDPSDLIPFWSQQNGRACCTTFFHLAEAVATIIINNNLIPIGTPLTVRDVDANIVTLVTNLIFDGAAVSTNGATVNATATITGASGIIPESGATPVKISAFEDAEFPINPGGTVTGLLSGANRNYTQLQLLSGKDALTDGPGTDVFGKAGDGMGTGSDPESPTYGGGGIYSLAGGNSSLIGGGAFYQGGRGLNNGGGGPAIISGGNTDGTGTAGGSFLTGGQSSSGMGGPANVISGGSTSGNAGDVNIQANFGATADGNINVTLLQGGGTPGNLFFINIPTGDPGEPNAIYNDAGVIKISL